MTIPANFTLSSERLLLRQPTADDIPHIFSAAQHPGFTDGMLWEPPQYPEELLQPLEKMITSS